MKTRIVHTKIWDDDWFQSLTINARILFFYLITCQDINICGIFELTDRKITFHTQLSGDDLQKAKQTLNEKILFHNGWVCIKNVDKYNSYKGPKNDSARVNELSKVPTQFIEYIRSNDTSIYTSIYTTLNTNHNQNTNTNQMSEEKKKKLKAVNEMKKELGMI